MEKSQVESLLQEGRDLFLAADSELLDMGVNERSLTHKFAEHLQIILNRVGTGGNWKVDCEYNRFGKDTKKVLSKIEGIVGPATSTDDTEAKTVYPDIIIHLRGSEGPNLLIIEAKKNPTLNEQSKDIRKIKAIMDEYNYSYGVFLKFNTEDQVIEWDYVDRTSNSEQ